jgi:hypothetical protein
MALEPETISIKRAAELSGFPYDELLDMAISGRLNCGIIPPNWRVHAMPLCKGISIEEVVPSNDAQRVTEYFVKCKPDKYSASVRVFLESAFWRIDRGLLSKAVHETEIDVDVLLPPRLEGFAIDRDLAPWDDFVLEIDEPYTVVEREKLRFIRDEILALAPKTADRPKVEVTPRERNTLLKIIAALAAECYGWTGDKPYALAKQIKKDSNHRGFNLKLQTIGDKLKEAAEHIPPEAFDP